MVAAVATVTGGCQAGNDGSEGNAPTKGSTGHSTRAPFVLQSTGAITSNRARVPTAIAAHDASVNTRDALGTPPLHAAVARGDVATVEFLLAHGAEVDAKHGRHLDVTHPKDHLIGPKWFPGTPVIRTPRTVRKKDEVVLSSNDTALHLAAAYGRARIAKLLLDYKADVDSRNRNRETPLHIAVSHGPNVEARKQCHQVALLLLASGAAPNAESSYNRTPLHRAARAGRSVSVLALIKYGARVNAKDKRGDTPLHYTYHVDVARILIANGADVNARNTFDRTPLHAAAHKSEELISLLIKSGAKVNMVSKYGRTPLDVAVRYRNDTVATLLKKHGGQSGMKLTP